VTPVATCGEMDNGQTDMTKLHGYTMHQ